MEVKNYFATDSQGNVLGSAQVYLYLAGTTTLASGLKNISGAALANPFTSQSNGLVQFSAPDDNYDLRVVKPGREFTIRIQCFDGVAFLLGVSQTPIPNGIPRANSSGVIDASWFDGSIPSASFSQSASYAAGSLSKHAQITVSVTDQPFGATTSGDATAAFQAAYDFVPAGGVIKVPGPGPYTVGEVTGTKAVTWEVDFDINTNLSLRQLPGRVTGGFGNAWLFSRLKNSGGEFATMRVDRVADYAGGSAGSVCSNIRATTTVSNNAAASFEWCATFVLDNSGRGQNVAMYAQGNRRAGSTITVGGTFAGVCEASDFTQEKDPASGLIGLEVDVFANDTDALGRRVAIDVVAGKGVSAGARCEVGHGLRFVPVLNDPARARFRTMITALGDKDYVLNVSGTSVENDINLLSTGGKIGVRVAGSHTDAAFVHDGTSPYGFRFSGTYSSGAAIRMPQGTGIAFESTGAIQAKYVGGSMQFLNGATLRQAFSMTTGAMSINGSQVVGPRDTGWAAMTGTSNKAAVYDVSSVTLPQLAARVAAMQAALTTHGMIGV